MPQLKNVDDKARYENAFFAIGRCAETFYLSDVTINATRLSPIEDWELLPPHKTLFGNDHGLPIGNITSQLFANFYLNDVDHLIKSRHKSYIRYVDDMIVVDRSKERIEETRRLVSAKLAEVNMKLNERKSVITKAEYGVDFLGIKIKPFYSILTGRRISRLWYTSRKFRNIEHAYISCASRKGMFNRYHGKRVSERWYNSLPEYYREHLKMDTNARFHLVGKQSLTDKKILRNICLYTDGQGENRCTTSMKTAL